MCHCSQCWNTLSQQNKIDSACSDMVRITIFSLLISLSGRYDIICLEDIVHSIFTADSNFKHTNTFLYNFTLNPPTGGWRGKGKKFKNGGDTGCRNEEINALLKLMIWAPLVFHEQIFHGNFNAGYLQQVPLIASMRCHFYNSCIFNKFV